MATVALISFFLAGIFFLLFLYFVPLGLWIRALADDVHVSLPHLVGMRLRRVPPDVIVQALVGARKVRLDVQAEILEAHFLAGGNVLGVINALIAADKATIDLDFERACAIDLAG